MNIKINTKKILIFLALLSIVSLIYIFFQNKENDRIIIPTPKPVRFELVKEIPKNGVESSILPTQSIEFQFSKPIDKTSLILTITPYEPFTFELIDQEKTLLVRPTPIWKEKTDYTIKFSVKSKEGDSLPEEMLYKFKIVPMTDSPLVD